MAKYLVIVESPAKVKTIEKFLGKDYDVEASGGHVRDLPKSTMGIDIENDFDPKYITIRGKGDVLARLRKQVKKSDKIYLATDPDREGEAISWHLYHALKLEDRKVTRISFNEITKTAVKASLKNARDINMNLVNAQQARRILDRLVGYSISPILWAKVKRGLSAGRVQSAALCMICNREEEINAFVPKEYWSITASLLSDGEKKPFPVRFVNDREGNKELTNEEQVNRILADLEKADFHITDVKTGTRSKKPPLPFTTSTMQQEAAKQLNFSTGKTMRIAQQLYEGVEIKGEGTVGIITYLRTDSVRISSEADESARAYVVKAYGEAYLGATAGTQTNSANIQDAHEAIRPTRVEWSPAYLKDSLSRDQLRLYQLIWKRFLAGRMSNASYETITVKLDADGYAFQTGTSRQLFDGFLSVYNDGEEKKDKNILSKTLSTDSKLSLEGLDKEQHFTQAEPHFTEASLVKALEEHGIGRPSTYSPTIMTLIGRRYIVKENKNLYITELGEVVNHMMKTAFPTIVDEEFTANMECLLDGVAEGKVEWKTIIRNFYPDLNDAVKLAEKELESVKIEDEVSDEVCEVCGRRMVVKYGPHGKFLACPGFPECKNTKPYQEKIGVPCPKCGKEILLKRTRKGRKYYGCEDNPDCDYMSWKRPVLEEEQKAQ